MRMKFIISIAILLVPMAGIKSQQMPIYSQYTLNKYLINPALAGAEGYSIYNFTAREQYRGFQNSPTTFAISGHTRLLEDSYISRTLPLRKDEQRASRKPRIGLGGYIYNDNNGIIRKTGFQVTYAYHIDMGDETQLSLGVSGSGYQFKLNDQGEVISDPDDPLLFTIEKSFFVPDANTGIYLQSNNFFGGISATNLFGSAMKLGRNKLDNYKTMRHYYVMAGYHLMFTEDLVSEPSLLVQTTAGSFQLDITNILYYKENYWLGLSYRTNGSLITMLGLGVENFYLGYAFDATLGSVRKYTSGTHELMVGVKFGDTNVRRYRWLKSGSSASR